MDREEEHDREELTKFLQKNDIAGNPGALTQAQAVEILRFKSLDTLRARLTEEGLERSLQVREGPIQRPRLEQVPSLDDLTQAHNLG